MPRGRGYGGPCVCGHPCRADASLVSRVVAVVARIARPGLVVRCGSDASVVSRVCVVGRD